MSNLKQIGLALRMFSNDHEENFPFNLSTSKGGTMEFCSRRSDGFDENAYLHFLVASNELNSPKILVCPADATKVVLTQFPITRANVSYQLRVGTNVNESNPKEILGRCPIHGHVVYCDGHAESTLGTVPAVENDPARRAESSAQNKGIETTEQLANQAAIEAEREFREKYDSDAIKILTYKRTGVRKRTDDPSDRYFTVSFEAELEFLQDRTRRGIDIFKGDRAKVEGALNGSKLRYTNSWSFLRPSLNFVSASRTSLLNQLQVAEAANQAAPAKSFCISNLKALEGAKATWALDHRKRDSDVPSVADLFGIDKVLKEKPICPRGGTYDFRAVSENPTCTVQGHFLP